MSVDTEIEGQPGSIEAAADWLRDKLSAKVGEAADRMNDARRNADASWQSEAGDEFSARMGKGRDQVEDLEQAAKKMAGDLDDFAEKLRRCQQQMRDIRADASGAGLSVFGFLIQDPGAGPARPPDHFVGTEAEVTEHNRKVAAYDAHQDLVRAYNHASSEAARIDRQYATACRDLQDDYTPGQHASWLLTTADILGDGIEGAIGASIGLKKSGLNRGAEALLDDAKRAIADLQAHPERYLKRKWLFFKTLDQARLDADRLAIQGRLDEAEDLLRKSSALDDLKLPKYLGRGGKVLGPLGFGLGVYNDYQEGESTTQIAVSQGVSTAAGIGAAALTGAGVGAAVGSVIPVAGTAVGAVVGTVVGAGVAIFADGAIDSLFENGPDIGAAFDEGVDALADTGGAIADGVSSAADTVGGWFH
ncbi:WXG100 family type VII secretion target [Nocardioides sp. URHA0020]|uniref:WXG100 family type VII secretion target n=1 Tax=Nocardioides sp. URHA0020 TaxID=1380392 RepID=UPI000490FC23|nr:hypothetical protein [Nocardioides sp. URHA0020]